MDELDWLAERFESERPHLRAVAYRLLGSLAEADDAVQESWLRVVLVWAVGAELLAAGFGLLLRLVDGLAGMRTRRVRFARYNGITAARDQRLHEQDLQCWE
jgi:RNA polymerase sigma-70 factor (ECF subfamily)